MGPQSSCGHWEDTGYLDTLDTCPELSLERDAGVHTCLVRAHDLLLGPFLGPSTCQGASLNPYLLGVGQVELGCQIDDLQLDNVLFCREGLGHFSQDVRCNLGDVLTVLADEPQDAGSGHGHLQVCERGQDWGTCGRVRGCVACQGNGFPSICASP